jgi:hypothetical protein
MAGAAINNELIVTSLQSFPVGSLISAITCAHQMQSARRTPLFSGWRLPGCSFLHQRICFRLPHACIPGACIDAQGVAHGKPDGRLKLLPLNGRVLLMNNFPETAANRSTVGLRHPNPWSSL